MFSATVIVVVLSGILAPLPVSAVTKDTEQCLTCHGPFDALVKKNVQTPAEPKPINPHVFVPHDSDKGEFFDCLICHARHDVPPVKGWKDDTASLDACIGCHHTQTFEKCSTCHDQKK